MSQFIINSQSSEDIRGLKGFTGTGRTRADGTSLDAHDQTFSFNVFKGDVEVSVISLVLLYKVNAFVDGMFLRDFR